MRWLQRQLEDPSRRRRLQIGFYIVLGLIVLAEVLLPMALGAGHPHFAFEEIPAWGSLYGLISCVAIIVVSKLIGKAWLMRPEDYYESREDTSQGGRNAASGGPA